MTKFNAIFLICLIYLYLDVLICNYIRWMRKTGEIKKGRREAGETGEGGEITESGER